MRSIGMLSLLKIPPFYLKLNSHYFGNSQKFSLRRNYIFLCNEKYYVLTCNFSKFKTPKNFGLIKKFQFDQKIGFKSIRQLQVQIKRKLVSVYKRSATAVHQYHYFMNHPLGSQRRHCIVGCEGRLANIWSMGKKLNTLGQKFPSSFDMSYRTFSPLSKIKLH